MGQLSDITAVILAGGKGSRLQSVLPGKQKVLAAVSGRPFLTYLLDLLDREGLKEAVLCTGHLGDQIQAALRDCYGSLHLAYSQEDAPLGTGGAIRLALSHLQSDPALVMNGDSFCRTDLHAFLHWHEARKARASILLTEVPSTNRFGLVKADGKGEVIQFTEKKRENRSGWINAGIYLIGKGLIRSIPPHRPVSLEEEMLPAWIGQGLYGYRSKGPFIDIGVPDAYASAETFFRRESAA